MTTAIWTLVMQDHTFVSHSHCTSRVLGSSNGWLWSSSVWLTFSLRFIKQEKGPEYATLEMPHNHSHFSLIPSESLGRASLLSVQRQQLDEQSNLKKANATAPPAAATQAMPIFNINFPPEMFQAVCGHPVPSLSIMHQPLPCSYHLLFLLLSHCFWLLNLLPLDREWALLTFVLLMISHRCFIQSFWIVVSHLRIHFVMLPLMTCRKSVYFVETSLNSRTRLPAGVENNYCILKACCPNLLLPVLCFVHYFQ